MKKILEFKINAPLVPNGRMKNQIITLNNLNRIHWATLSKAKNIFKQQLKEWFIEPNSMKYDSLLIIMEPIRHTRKKLDVSNLALALKWLEDVLTEQGYVDDDNKNEIHLLPAVISSENETMIKIKVYVKEEQ